MRINEGFILKEIAGNYVIVPVGENLLDFSSMITINETGAFLWPLLSENSVDELTKKLTSEYDIDTQTAKADIEEFIKMLSDNKILEA